MKPDVGKAAELLHRNGVSAPPAQGLGGLMGLSNKAMKQTRLAAAPGTPTQGAAAWPRWRETGATASQLIARVRWTLERR